MNITKLLKAAVCEKDVENAWRAALLAERPSASITSPHGCDGLISWGDVRALVEFKLDVDLKSRADVALVLAQLAGYVQRLAYAGELAPNVLVLADRNEIVACPASLLSGFLSLPFDWSMPPSSPDPALVDAIKHRLNFVPHVFDVGTRFKLGPVLEKIEGLARDGQHVTRATLVNVGEIFRHWREHVFAGKLAPVDQVDVFLRCLFDPCDVYLHPNRKNTLIVPGYAEGVQVHADRYRAFFDTFAQGYRPSEVEAFYAAKDRLIDDDARRRQGAFFTPRIWVDEAHRTIESVLGPTWRDDCIVWDPAAGTGNLTRDYAFADLIVSTAERSDVETIKAQGYNPGASIFQYDFLNPDAPSPFFGGELSKLPASVEAHLRAAAKAGKRLVFLMNPPYGTANNNAKDGTSKTGIADTRVGAAMKANKLGGAASQLYTQFMYQADVLANAFGFKASTVALFSKPTFMTSGTFAAFRTSWCTKHAFNVGFMFRAGHFADVSDAWGISFTSWSEGKTTRPIEIELADNQDFGVRRAGTKTLYNSLGNSASMWLRDSTLIPVLRPALSSGLVVSQTPRSNPKNGLFSGNFAGNNIMENATGVYLLSSASARSHDVGVSTSNFRRCVALFAARKLVTGTWINDKDEYLAPDETRDGYEQWVDDAHVFALLHPSNNCTAMRDVEYKGRVWTISNHLFWLRRADALAALDTPHTLALYRDCKAHPAGYVVPKPAEAPREQWEIDGDPYLASVIDGLALSPEARDVLERLDALWLASLPVRESFARERPELHLLAWDAGVYQLKHLWREHFAEDWEALRAAHKRLADKLRPGVYDFGFLLR